VIAQLSLGSIKITLEGGAENTIFISSGYLEVNNNEASILADQAENIEEIALEQVKAARKKAEEMLKTAKSTEEIEKLYQELKMQALREQLAGIAKFKKEK
jgi:F-type H+-transporting ATPase subunit epsilon